MVHILYKSVSSTTWGGVQQGIPKGPKLLEHEKHHKFKVIGEQTLYFKIYIILS